MRLDEIPLLAGHAAVIGWYENMAKALNAPRRDNEYIRQLYQAALAVPIRIRLDPTIETAQLDSLQYSEMLRQSSTACIDSFWEFVSKVAAIGVMNAVLEDKRKTIKEVIAAAERLKLRFKGKPLSTSLATGLRALNAFVQDKACRDAYRLLETVSTCMNDATKLWRLAALTTTQFANLGTREAAGAFARVLTHLRVEIVSNALAPSCVSATWLTAYNQSKVAGYAHYVFKQLSFVEYMESVIKGQPEHLTFIKEIVDKVLPKLATPEATYAAFMDPKLVKEEAPDEEEAEKHGAACPEQFGERTLDRFTSFKNAHITEQPSKVVGEILYSVWNGSAAEELKLRAVEDLSSQQPVPWPKYLAKLDDAEEPTLLRRYIWSTNKVSWRNPRLLQRVCQPLATKLLIALRMRGVNSQLCYTTFA